MKKRRVEKISEEIKRVISELLIEDIKDPRINEMTSITAVEVTNDLSYADVYISSFGSEKETQETLDGFRAAKGFIKGKLGEILDLRHIPELNFKIDNSYDKGARIDSIIRKLHEDTKND